jgi:hypothetical protein
VNGQTVSSTDDILRAVQSSPVGSHVSFVFAVPADRDAFKLAVAVLKQASAVHDAVIRTADESRRPEALGLFIDGAAQLTEAIW